MDVVVCKGKDSDIPACLGIASGLPAYFTQSALGSMGHDLATQELVVARNAGAVTSNHFVEFEFTRRLRDGGDVERFYSPVGRNRPITAWADCGLQGMTFVVEPAQSRE